MRGTAAGRAATATIDAEVEVEDEVDVEDKVEDEDEVEVEVENTLYGRAASRALADVEVQPERRRLLGVVGVRGTGKSAVLRQIATRLRNSGTVVHHRIGAIEDALARDDEHRHALLVDDAHQLDDGVLDRIRALACDDKGPSVVVGYRPWPGRAALSEITARLDAHDEPVILSTLTVEEAREWWEFKVGIAPSDDDLELLVELTGGMPWLIDRALASIRERGTDFLDSGEFGDELVERVALELSRLDAAVYELALALTVGFDLSSLIVPASSHFNGEQLDDVVEAARAAGILRIDDRLVPMIAEVVLKTAPAHRISVLQLELLDALTAAGHDIDTVAVRAAALAGLKDARVGAALVRLGDAALRVDPARAAERYEAAIEAGIPADTVRARQAQAQLASGDVETAGRLLERHFQNDDPADIGRAVDVAAALWSERCMPTRSADVFAWYGAERVGRSAPIAAVALFAAGRADEAKQMLSAPADAFPTALAVSTRMTGEGVQHSIYGDASTALPSLVRASTTLTATDSAVPLPELPGALAGLVALHNGDLATAASVLDAAIEGGQGGPVGEPRLRLLRAWTAMLADDETLTRAEIAAARRPLPELPPRDEFFALTLEIALARRASDLQELTRVWGEAREYFMTVSMGLFTLLPLGELVMAAARMRDTPAVEPALADAWRILEQLGNPPLWSALLHWSCVQAGITSNRPDTLAPHASALVRAAPHHPLSAALAEAGRAWVHLLGDQADATEIEAAARRLAAAGLLWDGARLAGHGAGRVAERKDMLRLLQTARELHPEGVASGRGEARSNSRNGSASATAQTQENPRTTSSAATDSSTDSAPGANGAGGATRTGAPSTGERSRNGETTRIRNRRRAAAGGDPIDDAGARPGRNKARRLRIAVSSVERDTLGLSSREREVALLVLDGKTYAEIGDTLFISPRTAEHHMARIRRRLGVSSRSEMLDVLRSALGGRD